jgi:hypothetical protein
MALYLDFLTLWPMAKTWDAPQYGRIHGFQTKRAASPPYGKHAWAAQ